MDGKELARALVNPAKVFAEPMSVVREGGLTRAQKIDILRRWEYDAREIQVEEEESPLSRDVGGLLDAVLAALHALGTGPDTERSPPTKQGGV